MSRPCALRVLIPLAMKMNLGIAELLYIFGIVVLLALITAMIAGVALAISRRRRV